MNAITDSRRVPLRAGLALLAITPAWVGAWTTVAPRSFYDQFPGAGRHWVSPLGAYDEHLLRDFGAASLGLLALLVFAFVVMERRLLQGALIAVLMAGVPHFGYHLTTTARLSTGDNVASLAGLGLNVLLPLAMLRATRTPRVAFDSWKRSSGAS